MFNIFKSKNQKKNPENVTEKVYSEEDIINFREKIKALKAKVSSERSGKEISDTYNEIGNLYLQMGDKENAVKAFELGFDNYKQMSENYKQLLSLYTKLQIEAAVKSDFESEKSYSEKLNDLRNEAKKMVTH